jgi:hypothetical protein
MKKSLQTAMAAAFLLAGLALEPRIQQFVLNQLGLEPTSETENGNSIAPQNVLTPNDLLIQEGRSLGVLSLNGKQHPILQQAAERHASYQSDHRMQGHQNWEQRILDLQQRLPKMHFVEVANESWPGQSVENAAREMFRSWSLSDGHWAAVNGECKIWGYAMVLSSNGMWYACGIFGR